MRLRALTLLGFAFLMCVAAPLYLAQAGGENKRVTVHFANEVLPLETSASTVAGLLEELSIVLPSNVNVDPPLSQGLSDGDSVFLQSLVVTRGETEREVPATVQISENWHFGPEQVVLTDPGQPGLVKASCTIFYAGEQEVGRRQREETIREMRPQKVVCFRQLDSEDGPSAEEILATRAVPSSDVPAPRRYKQVFDMQSTAYEPGPTSCGNASGNTAIGLQAGYGVVAVDPDVIPLGSRVFIEGYGYAVAGDTGGAIKGNKIDVGFKTVAECYDWGRRQVKVYLLY